MNGRELPAVDGIRDARDVVRDVDPLLPSEDPNTPYAEDVEHWVSVYSELLGVQLRVLGLTEAPGPVDPPAQLRRIRRRLEFWRARARQLTSGGPS